MDGEQAGKEESAAAPPPLPPRGIRRKSLSDLLDPPPPPLPLRSNTFLTTSSNSDASLCYPFNYSDAPKPLQSFEAKPPLTPPTSLKQNPCEDNDPANHKIERPFKPRLSLTPTERRKATEWYVPFPKPERPRPPSNKTTPLTMDRRGFLEMWHAKKYEPMWVTFDGKTLSVYEQKESHFPKFFLTTASLKVVMEKDDTEFSVSTQRQMLIFRDKSPEERDMWVQVLQHYMSVQPAIGHPILGENIIKKQGNLLLKEPKSKVLVAVINDRAVMFNSKEDFADGFGMLSIAMNIVKVKKGCRNSLEIITPQRTFCFSANSETEAEEWVDVMSAVARDSLCSDEVAKRIWSLPENCVCADCESPQPEWVSVNLVAVICSNCAGQHRSLGPSISHVKSLRMDINIWTEPLIQLLIRVGNKGAGELWALNVPPSERITSDSLPEDRHRFIYAKYREGKYRRFHPLYGEQVLLNEALCQAVLSDDNISETMLLVFSGAQVTCRSRQPDHPTPIALAEEAGQLMQLEFLKQNEYKETPCPDPVLPQTPSPPEKPSKRGMWKSASQDTPSPDPRFPLVPSPPEHSKRGGLRKSLSLDNLPIQLQDNKLSFYSDGTREMTHSVELQEILSLARCPMGTWVAIWTPAGPICQDSTQEKATLIFRFIAQALMEHRGIDANVVEGSERMTLVKVSEEGSPEGQEAWALLKPKDILIMGAKLKGTCAFSTIQNISFNVEEHLMNIQTTKRVWELEFLFPSEFNHWCSVLCDITNPPNGDRGKMNKKGKKLDATSPALYHCLQHLNQHGLMTVGIYRQCARKSRLEDLLAALKREGTKPTLKLSKYTEHEVAGALKQLLREMDSEELFTEDHSNQLMQAAEVKEETDRTALYRTLMDFLPIQNKLLLKELFMHLNTVNRHASLNKMAAPTLATVFAPTLMHSCLNLKASTRLVHDFIVHYPIIFNVR